LLIVLPLIMFNLYDMQRQLLLLVTFIFITLSLSAQFDSLKINRFELSDSNLVLYKESEETQIIAASRSSRDLADLPVTVYVITRDEILRNGYVTLVDVLRTLPGIKASQPGSAEEGETFLLRGLSGNYYSKILINNIPIQPTVVQGMPIAAQLPIRQAQRIEVIYGPASTVFGADATIGVINIITQNAESNLFAHADANIGENQYRYLNFSVGGKSGKGKNKLAYNIYGSQCDFLDMNLKNNMSTYNPLFYIEQSPGFIELGKDTIQPTKMTSQMLKDRGLSEKDFVNGMFPPNYNGKLTEPDMGLLSQSSYLMGFNIKYRGFTLSYNDMYRKIHSSIGRTPFLFNYNNPQSLYGEYIKRYTLNYEKKIKKFFSTTTLSYLRYRLDNTSSRSPTYNYFTQNVFYYMAGDDIFAEQLVNYRLGKNFEIVAGAAFQYSGALPLTNELTNPFNTKDYTPFSTSGIPEDNFFGKFGLNPVTSWTLGGFLQMFYTFKKLSLMYGTRRDYHSVYGNKTTPRFAVLYKFNDKMSVRLSHGSSYKAPSAANMYYSLAIRHPNDSINYAFLPNKKLKPENFESWEAGFRLMPSKKLFIDLSVYENTIENLISPILTSPDTSIYPKAIPVFASPTRTQANSDAKSKLFGMNILVKRKDLLESIHLDVNLSANVAWGHETLPNVAGDTGYINRFRGMPKVIFQAGISMIPMKNLYIHIDNVSSSEWYRKFELSSKTLDQWYSKTKGYSIFDLIVNYQITRQFNANLRITNLFNSDYAGIDATGTDVDLQYNPQLGRNIRFGLTYRFE
jgi:outer membrane receptor protein involved in Fe transport